MLRRLGMLRHEAGVAFVEYVFIISVVGLGAVASLTVLKGDLTGLFDRASSSVESASQGTTAQSHSPAPPSDGTSVDSVAGSTGIPAGASWFDAGTLTSAGGPGPAGVYSDVAATGSCTFTRGGFSFSGTWQHLVDGYTAPGYGEYHYVCA